MVQSGPARNFREYLRFSVLSCVVGLLFSACGGGGSSTPPPVQTPNPVPAVASLSPASLMAGAPTTTVTITGTGFISSSTAKWNSSARPTTFASSTQLTVALTAADLASAGTNQITVMNPAPGGGVSTAATLTINNPSPVMSAINPASMLAGSADTLLDVTGSGFVSLAVITWNGSALTTTFVSGTELKATLPAADMTGSSASQIAVQNPAPGGGTSPATTFNVNSPVAAITAISPRIVPPGRAATITITGTGFEANSAVLWNGSARATTFVSPTSLQVALSASDLQSPGIGALTVNNPGPGASTSPASQLTVTSQPVPVIQSVNITSGPGMFTTCPQLQVTITGQNFSSDSTIQANGSSLPSIGYPVNTPTVIDYLPLGFVSKPGALSFTVTNPYPMAIVSDPFPYPSTSALALALCATLSPTTVYAPSNFSFIVQPSAVNMAGNGTLTLGSLPPGITATNSSIALPPTGAALHLQAANSTAAGTYDLVLNASAGTATAKGDFNFTVSTSAPPAFSFVSPLSTDVGVPIGGSGSIQYATIVGATSGVDYYITPSVSGLPPGTTATFSPTVFSAGQSVTVTLSAANNAPVTQNAILTLTGTPSAQTSNATASFFADVTQAPGFLPGNRTDFVSTAGHALLSHI
jgi:hypothetical protein